MNIYVYIFLDIFLALFLLWLETTVTMQVNCWLPFAPAETAKRKAG